MVGTDPVTGAAPTRNADFHTSALMLAPVLQLRRACDGKQVQYSDCIFSAVYSES